MTTVRTDVVERPQYAVAAPHDDDAFTDNIAGDVGVVFGYFAAMGDADPTLGEDRLFLILEHCWLRVVRGRKGVSVFDIGAKIGRQFQDGGHDGSSLELLLLTEGLQKTFG